MRIAHINVRSLTQNFNNFRQHVLSNDLDVVAVSETWLGDNILDTAVHLDGYSIIRRDRPDGRRGEESPFIYVTL